MNPATDCQAREALARGRCDIAEDLRRIAGRCADYDPVNGRYGAMVMNLVRIGGVLTVVFLGGFA